MNRLNYLYNLCEAQATNTMVNVIFIVLHSNFVSKWLPNAEVR